MKTAYLLICITPVAFIIGILAAIVAAGARTWRSARRSFEDLKPLFEGLAGMAADAQRKLDSITDRGNRCVETFDEIGGRFTFIAETFNESLSSPAARLAGMAGKLAAGRNG